MYNHDAIRLPNFMTAELRQGKQLMRDTMEQKRFWAAMELQLSWAFISLFVESNFPECYHVCLTDYINFTGN
jgi:hypothetical protein